MAWPQKDLYFVFSSSENGWVAGAGTWDQSDDSFNHRYLSTAQVRELIVDPRSQCTTVSFFARDCEIVDRASPVQALAALDSFPPEVEIKLAEVIAALKTWQPVVG
jgi:hypothetical protein